MESNINTDIKRKKTLASSKLYLSYLRDITFWITGIILVYSLFFRVVSVSGPSMNTTLVHGDCLILLGNTLAGEPERGDIIVASKQSYDNGTPIIKRVIATEGQTVDIDFVTGTVYVDGIALNEDYISTPTTRRAGIQFPLTVDDGCIFVMGDNREVSKDSRSTDIGLIDKREVVGKAVFLLFPGNNDGKQERDFKRIGVLN